MPGLRSRWQFNFPDGVPWPLKALFIFLFTNFITSLAVMFWTEHYAQRLPSATSPFAIHFKGGLVAFVPSWLGMYEQWDLWLHFFFLASIGALFCWYTLTGQAVRDN